MRVVMDSSKFLKEMNNFVSYHQGFLEGAKSNRDSLMRGIGDDAIEALKMFIDSNARVNPETLHHVYEWHRTGSPDARLFDFVKRVGGGKLSIGYTLRQSSSLQKGSTTPFYSKARIMEEGSPVTIFPVRRRALKFEVGGEDVFVRGSVTVTNPGGAATTGAMERVFDSFFDNYFTQSFLQTSGMIQHMKKLEEYRKGLPASTTIGRSAGLSAGKKWVSRKAGLSVEFIAP
jgi:hypothetical protein